MEEKVEVTTTVSVLNTKSSDKGDLISPVEISEMPLDRPLEDSEIRRKI
jgi:hypothetical protein